MADGINISNHGEKLEAVMGLVSKSRPDIIEPVENNVSDPDFTLAVTSILKAMPEGKGVDISQALKDTAARIDPQSSARVNALSDVKVDEIISQKLQKKGVPELIPVLSDRAISADELKAIMVDAGNSVKDFKDFLPEELEDMKAQVQKAMPEADDRTVTGLAAVELVFDHTARDVAQEARKLGLLPETLPFNRASEGSAPVVEPQNTTLPTVIPANKANP